MLDPEAQALLADVLTFLRQCCSPGADALQARVEQLLPHHVGCEHQWVDAHNGVVESGLVCVRCGAIAEMKKGVSA